MALSLIVMQSDCFCLYYSHSVFCLCARDFSTSLFLNLFLELLESSPAFCLEMNKHAHALVNVMTRVFCIRAAIMKLKVVFLSQTQA